MASRVHAIDRVALVLALPGFDELPVALIEELAAGPEEVAVPAVGVVVREGDAGDRCFVIAGDRFEFSVEEDGEARPVGGAGPGGYLGELALVLPEGRRTATVTALSDLDLLALDAASFADTATRAETKAALDAHVEPCRRAPTGPGASARSRQSRPVTRRAGATRPARH